MPTPPVTIQEFKARFVRDFIYGTTSDTVMDLDITNALNDATLLFNSDQWVDSLELKTAFLLAAAHALVLNVQAAGGLSASGMGVQSHGGGVIASKSVGSASVGYAHPSSVTEDPILSQFMRTDYGMRYLQMVRPRCVGNIGIVEGWAMNGDEGTPAT